MAARSLRLCIGPARLGFAVLALGLLAALAGCGADTDKGKDKSAKKEQLKDTVKDTTKDGPRREEVTERKQGGKPVGSDRPQPRKIIYTGDITLVVEDFERAEKRLRELIQQHDAYVARSDVQGVSDEPREGSWTVRVPVARADDFREAVSALGELRTSKLDSSDITDQYHDTRAELANREAEEKALRKLFEDKAAGTKVSDLLEVRRELARVRGEINLLKGRVQRWDMEVAFTTLTVSIHERLPYVSPTAPNFGTTVARSFQGSLESLVTFGKFIVLSLVVLVPWLVVLLLVATPALLIVRRTYTKPPASTVASAAPAPSSTPPTQ